MSIQPFIHSCRDCDWTKLGLGGDTWYVWLSPHGNAQPFIPATLLFFLHGIHAQHTIFISQPVCTTQFT